MKLTLGIAMAIAGVGFAVPSGAATQLPPPSPTQDSVVLSEPTFVGDPSFPTIHVNALSARSGPSGENPTGHGEVNARGIGLLFSGPATCLAVRGNSATINFEDQATELAGTIFTVQVTDGQPDTLGLAPPGRAPTDCSPSPFGEAPILTGDITVVDAEPLPPPTSKDQCKAGGWEQFGFKNQGQCVAFVQSGPK
jgi:hypothetical protein